MYTDTDVKYIKGVGPVKANLLNKELEISTVNDLLYYFPYRYIDKTVVHHINELEEDMPMVQLKGKIYNISSEGEGRKRRIIATFSDGTGWVELVWFNQIKTIEKVLKYDTEYLIFGKATLWNGRFSMIHPEMETSDKRNTEEGYLQALYHTTEKMKKNGISSKTMHDIIQNALSIFNLPIQDTLPQYILEAEDLVDLDTALHTLHCPTTAANIATATRRMKFEELFFLQLQILKAYKSRKEANLGLPCPKVGEMFNHFYTHCLPFSLTEAQKKVVKEIRSDMKGPLQMNRLLQGDVGSGKTMVALLSALIAIDNGYQATIMAPTEILAEQHFQSISALLGDTPVSIKLLTGNTKRKERNAILKETMTGELHILVGTHALIEPTVKWQNLGLAIIDEQHRFGVKQRAALWSKNLRPPHILVMTATPIPRTLAMTVYGDLDTSIINQLPPGRKPITTIHYKEIDRAKLYEGIRHQLQLGVQIYFVFPLIAESEKIDLKNLEEGFVNIEEIFSEYKVGKVHGKMTAEEKENTMQQFKRGELHILVSTTVIEVGVNVPQAAVMVIENAERFGLSALHQLRGRVGRGEHKSYCILMTKDKISETAKRRIDVLVESTDGFRIAEEDMKLRGPGDIEGTQQSGLPINLRIAHLVKDTEIMEKARSAAKKVLDHDPTQSLPQNECIWRHIRKIRQNNEYGKIS